jgi:anthranilate phosphoribosyltransferase
MIAGICAAVFEKDIGKSTEGFLTIPGREYVLENCGMGGDTIPTPNVSCLAGICAASAGITMVKHGSRSHTNPSGSTDFLEACGIPMDLPSETIQRSVDKFHLGYIDAVDTRFKRIHRMTMERSRVSHLSHIVGPITSPVHPHLLRRRVIGVNQNVNSRMVAQVYQILNDKGVTQMDHLLVVRGHGDTANDFMDEVSITRNGTEVTQLRNNAITEFTLNAKQFGFPEYSCEELCIPPGREKGEYSRAILNGEANGAALDLVSANAALLFHLADPKRDLRDCAEHARKQFTSGAARQHMLSLREYLRK